MLQLDPRTLSNRIKSHQVMPHEAYKNRGGATYLLADVAKAAFSDVHYCAINPDELSPRDRKDFYDSELKADQLRKLRGELIETSEARIHFDGITKSLLNFFDSFTTGVVVQLSDKQQSKIEKYIRDFRKKMIEKDFDTCTHNDEN